MATIITNKNLITFYKCKYAELPLLKAIKSFFYQSVQTSQMKVLFILHFIICWNTSHLTSARRIEHKSQCITTTLFFKVAYFI